MASQPASGGNTSFSGSMATLQYEQDIIRSDSSDSGESSRGQWGEHAEGGRVEVDKAINEFEE